MKDKDGLGLLRAYQAADMFEDEYDFEEIVRYTRMPAQKNLAIGTLGEFIAELSDRGKELRSKRSRMKQSLEATVCRADEFTGSELIQLMQHPILAPQLSRSRKKTGKTAGQKSTLAASRSRYKLNDDKSSKFWEISINGSEVTTTWGRIGTQ